MNVSIAFKLKVFGAVIKVDGQKNDSTKLIDTDITKAVRQLKPQQRHLLVKKHSITSSGSALGLFCVRLSSECCLAVRDFLNSPDHNNSEYGTLCHIPIFIAFSCNKR